jgi:hypothetical protein
MIFCNTFYVLFNTLCYNILYVGEIHCTVFPDSNSKLQEFPREVFSLRAMIAFRKFGTSHVNSSFSVRALDLRKSSSLSIGSSSVAFPPTGSILL